MASFTGLKGTNPAVACFSRRNRNNWPLLTRMTTRSSHGSDPQAAGQGSKGSEADYKHSEQNGPFVLFTAERS